MSTFDALFQNKCVSVTEIIVCQDLRPYALMTKQTGAYLVYPEGTETAKYGPDVCRQASSKPLKKYIQ